jgi:hypothetical protein
MPTELTRTSSKDPDEEELKKARTDSEVLRIKKDQATEHGDDLDKELKRGREDVPTVKHKYYNS